MDGTTAAQSLEVRRIIPASPARVYDAWTTPELMTQWFAPSPDYTVVVHQSESRVGGSYRVEMRHPNGASHVAIGEYLEMSRPRRLVFTWGWEGTMPADTVVTIELHPSGSGTELVLTHTRFPTDAYRDEHLKGWTACLDRLVALQ